MEYYMPEPPKNNSNGFSIIILLAIIAFLLYSLKACLSNPKHYCNWVDCEYQGEVISKLADHLQDIETLKASLKDVSAS